MTLAPRIEAALGAPVARMVPLHGGDLSEVRRIDLADHRRVVAKTGPRVEAEARMLRALGDAGAPAPHVLHVEPGLIVLNHLDEGAPDAAGWRQLGRALRSLHAHHATRYGWAEDYGFDPVVIPNRQSGDWPRFWTENRLLAAPESLPPDLRPRVEALAARLPDLLPKAPAASLLHGDLWAGNVLFTSDGGAVLIDPACYNGHAEVDLAMLTLFGSPPPSFFDGYGPLEPGHRQRQVIYQLWPALVHLRLFGAGYRGLVSGLLDRAGA